MTDKNKLKDKSMSQEEDRAMQAALRSSAELVAKGRLVIKDKDKLKALLDEFGVEYEEGTSLDTGTEEFFYVCLNPSICFRFLSDGSFEGIYE